MNAAIYRIMNHKFHWEKIPRIQDKKTMDNETLRDMEH